MSDDAEIKHDYAVYIMARTDLPSMNSGKLGAQIHHSGVQMAVRLAKDPLFNKYLEAGRDEGADNFSTTIVLAASKDDIERVLPACASQRYTMWSGKVVDPTYPFVVDREISNLITGATFVEHIDERRSLFTREELTCAWFIGDREDPTFKNLFEGLSLHP